MKSLEIGPGEYPVAGFDSLTADLNQPATYHCFWGNDLLPIEDETYDLVYASHVIEHVPWYRVHAALKEVYRILKPGGSFEVWTVNFRVVTSAFIQEEIPDDWRRMNPHDDFMTWINGRLFAYETEGTGLNFHKSCFTFQSLVKLLQDVGFKEPISIFKPRGIDHGPVNLGVAAWKE
jgi:predicted SAM-dependent methyltransferase